MTISTKARQAKIDALNTVLALIEDEINNPTGLKDFDGNLLVENPLYIKALDQILVRLEDERDEAALRQYILADRRALKQEMREAMRTRRKVKE